jgi:amino acid adenylation domain-containing protein
MISEMNIDLRPEYEWARLSPGQRRLWILHQFDSRDASWNRPLAVQLTGRLDVSALERSVNEIVVRHGVLRTVFAEIDGEPMQRMQHLAALDWEVRDLGFLPEQERLGEAKRIAAQEAHKVFDLVRGPLLRARLLGLSSQTHVLLILMHHIVFDGWSEHVLLDELAALYEAYSRGESTSPLPELTIQYVDFANRQNRRLAEGALEIQLNYWRRQLHGLSPLSLPTDSPRTAHSDHHGAKHSMVVPFALTGELKELSRKRHATLFMTLFTAFHTLLSRYTGQNDFAIGVPIAGRTEVESERLIGCFMNVLVLRAETRTDDSFEEALDRVRQVALEAYGNQDVPFEKLVEELRPERTPNHWPLFQVMLNLRNMPRSEVRRAGELTIEPFSFDSRLIGGLDLSLEVVDKPNGLHCNFNYPCSLFDSETICRMAQHFHRLLEGIVAYSGRSTVSLPLLSESERRQLLVEWNNTGKAYPSDQCLHELFEIQAVQTPNSVAVICGDRQLSYRDLDEQSNQVARYLRKRGVGPDVLVALCLHRSAEIPVLILGILKAGGAYVPLDPEFPESRLRSMIRDAQVPILMTSAELARSRNLSDLGPDIDVMLVDTEWKAIAREDTARLVRTNGPENLAYVIYTSGSLGTPKAVMVPHSGVCNYLIWRCDYFPLSGADRVLQTSSFSFDDSVWELFEPLSVGAAVIIPEAHEFQDVSKLVALLSKHRVTAVCFVPSLLEAVIEDPAFAACRDLRRVTTGGEGLPAQTKNRFVERFTGRLYNGYGPTEATIAATFYRCDRDVVETTVPIGRPIANAQIYILDPYFNPVPVGIAGEIYIGGAGVCRGYLNNPGATAEIFVPDPYGLKGGGRLYKSGDWGRYLPDGNIQFTGRRDQQVKIRGYRIELEEIERVLRCHPHVRQAVVTVLEPLARDKRLAAYYVVATESAKIGAKDVRSFLTSRLPSYMVPSVFVPMESLPRTRSGKVDRQALAATERPKDESSDEYVAPRSSLEATLAALWSELLGCPQIGVGDNFFERGGHSLLATRLISRLRENFCIELQLRDLFEHPTIADFARFLISQIPPADVGNALVEIEALSETKAHSLLQSDPTQLRSKSVP